MRENRRILSDNCDFKKVHPIMVNAPYPPIQVRAENREYAQLLSHDYCGNVSELSAITQYINNENRMSCEHCEAAKTILGIAMAEMIHLQKLGQLIFLLGGTIDYCTRSQGEEHLWSPDCLDIPRNIRNMILADIESERGAINQYCMHMRMIKDSYINAVLARIIQDEKYHIEVLQGLLKKL